MPLSHQLQDLFNVNGLVAVATGGGSGLGLYAARALDANGAKAVYILGRREQPLKDAAKTGLNSTIKPIGYVNFLFANAGISGPKDRASLSRKESGKPTIKKCQEPLWQPEMSAYTTALHMNCTGVYYTALAFLPLLEAGKEQHNVPQDSQILVTSSVAGFSRQLASSFAYSTSKAAVNHLVKMFSTISAQHGFHIRCNLLAPGLYPSEMAAGHTSTMEKFGGVEGHERAWEDARVQKAEMSPAERTGGYYGDGGVYGECGGGVSERGVSCYAPVQLRSYTDFNPSIYAKQP